MSKLRSRRVDLGRTPEARRRLQDPAVAAFDTLADRTVCQVDEMCWAQFMTELSSTPKNNPKLRKPLARKPTWKA